MAELVDSIGFGRVAEWFKAAVLKTAVRPMTKSANLAEKQTKSTPLPDDFHANLALFGENESGSQRHDIRHSLLLLRSLPAADDRRSA